MCTVRFKSSHYLFVGHCFICAYNGIRRFMAMNKIQIYVSDDLRKRVVREQRRREVAANAEISWAAVVRDLLERGLSARERESEK